MSSDAASPKKRRTRVALKPKAGTAGCELSSAATHTSFTSGYSTVPRVMRSRIAKATRQPRSKAKPSGETEVPNQPIARSNSGKVALGPCTHKELNETQRGGGEGTEAKRHRKGTALATSPAALIEIPPPDETTMKLHSREVATLQQKPIVANWGRSDCGKQACKGRQTAKIGFINQPKRGL